MQDLISRQAAIDAIDKNRQDLLFLRMYVAEHILVHYGRRVIEELPTADPVKNKLQCAIDGKTEEEIYDFLSWLMFEYAKQAESGFIPQEKSKNEPVKTTDNLRRTTYDELLEMFEDRFPFAKYVDYRPICHEIFTDDKIGITIFFENGDVIEYYPATAERKESCKT